MKLEGTEIEVEDCEKYSPRVAGGRFVYLLQAGYNLRGEPSLEKGILTIRVTDDTSAVVGVPLGASPRIRVERLEGVEKIVFDTVKK